MDGSKYLKLAEKIISVRGTPLTGSQIIEFAHQYDALPYDSYQTIVKTLQARLAEDIAKNRTSSRFVRTGIGRYFLRRLLSKSSVFGGVKWSNLRTPRKKPEHPNRILTIPSSLWSNKSSTFMDWGEMKAALEAGRYEYQSEISEGYIPVICAVSLMWREHIFCFRVGAHTHFERLSDQKTVLLRKYLDEFDLDLFETDGTGATSGTARAALPVLKGGRRARLEYGRLSREEMPHFYQVSGLLKHKTAFRSPSTNSISLVSTIDLSGVYNTLPETHRRLEMNAPAWAGSIQTDEQLTDVDAETYMRFIKRSERKT